jgi:hypothetical protein
VDSAPGTLDTLNEIAAALADDASFSTTITGQIAAKQDGSAHLTSVVTAARTVSQLQSLDTTSSIQDALNLKAADSICVKLTGAQTIAGVKEFSDQITGSISGSSATVQSLTGTNLINTLSDSSTFHKMTAAERTLLGTTHADLHVAHTAALAGKQATITDGSLTIARTSGLQTALDAKISATGENQGITQNSNSAILTLTNMTADTKTISCVGGDGSISVVSGVAVECDRQGPMYVRNNMGSGSVVLQARSTNAIVVDDKVTIPVSLVLTKGAPSSATDTGIVGEIRVDDTYIYVCTSSNIWRRTSVGAAW